MQNLHSFEYSAKAFRCHVHHYQCFMVPVKLAEMLVCGWHVWLCQRVCEFYNIIGHLVSWLVIVYGVCIFHVIWFRTIWDINKHQETIWSITLWNSHTLWPNNTHWKNLSATLIPIKWKMKTFTANSTRTAKRW